MEIEVLQKDQDSELSGRGAPVDQRYIQQNTSEISSMPPDSMLGSNANAGAVTPKRTRSRSISRDAVVHTTDMLKTPSRRRSRSLSKERLTQKVIAKLEGKSRQTSEGRSKHGSKSRSQSLSKEQMVELSPKSSKRRSSRHHHEEELASGAESSLLTSQLSPGRKSGDQYSFRSGTSKSSINNPKLLETVEDAIRRLILPELTTLKQEQKMQQNRNRFEKDQPVAPGSSVKRDEIPRRVSKHASAPDVKSKPKVVLNRDENNAGTLLSGNSIKGRKDSRRKDSYGSPSERNFERGASEETVVRDNGKVRQKRSKDSQRSIDMAATGMAGGSLTTAALRHHDSKSSVDRKERRRRSSKSHSRSVSYAGSTEEIFHKHDVPPMPMRSEIHSSELTRDSILSERTEGPPLQSPELRRQEIREVSRSSPREVLSPASRTPNRTPLSLQKGLATHHSNLSQGNLSAHSIHSSRSDHSLRDERQRSKLEEAGRHGVAADEHAAAQERFSGQEQYDEDASLRIHEPHSRGLSPIQSVASYREENEMPRHESRRTHSSDSLSLDEGQNRKGSTLSIKSLSSVASTNIARSNRPKGINLEDEKTILDQHNFRDSTFSRDTESPRGSAADDDWYEQEHEKNNRYRQSMAESSDRGSLVDVQHMTNYSDDSLYAPNLDKVTAAQPVRGMGANPEYIHTPVAVESAVASLHDPSILSVRSKHEDKAYAKSTEGEIPEEIYHAGTTKGLGLENTEEQAVGKRDLRSLSSQRSHRDDNESAADSPRQSVARSTDEHDEHVPMGAIALPNLADPLPEVGHYRDSDSDLNTNPSIIQGPIGGLHQGNRDHWPSEPTPPQQNRDFVSHSDKTSAHESLKAAAKGFMSTAALASQDHSREKFDKPSEQSLRSQSRAVSATQYENGVNHDFGPIGDSYISQPIPTPPANKDEGYVSAHHQRSAGATPDIQEKGTYNPLGEAGLGMVGDDDPFVATTHTRHLSGNSHGMASPLYDSATGGGMDRIQSKDIVALMDHVSFSFTVAMQRMCR